MYVGILRVVCLSASLPLSMYVYMYIYVCIDVEYIYGFVGWGVCMQSR